MGGACLNYKSFEDSSWPMREAVVAVISHDRFLIPLEFIARLVIYVSSSGLRLGLETRPRLENVKIVRDTYVYCWMYRGPRWLRSYWHSVYPPVVYQECH